MPISFEDVYKQKEQVESNKFQPKEAYNRLLISRGYYASFSYACYLVRKKSIKLIRKDENGDNYGSHEMYYETLIQSEDKVLVEIGDILKSYHKLRKNADYKLNKSCYDYDVMVAETYYKDCRELIDSILN